MGNLAPEIQVSVATGISGLFAVLLFGNTDFDLCPPLFEKGDNDVIQTVIVERKIPTFCPAADFRKRRCLVIDAGYKVDPAVSFGADKDSSNMAGIR